MSANLPSLKSAFSSVVPHLPTSGQEQFFTYFEAFLASNKPNCTLLLKGYAGTGKTTLLSAVVSYLEQIEVAYVLMAPTGRAAKVMSNYTKRSAFTIHKTIYHRKVASDGSAVVEVKPNLFPNTVFVVDESSMIQCESNYSSDAYGVNTVLSDLMEFVKSGHGCKLLLVGDTAQLPPVGSKDSLALKLDWLKNEFDLTIAQVELSEVLRQTQESGILYNATQLRKLINGAPGDFCFTLNYPDIKAINGLELQDELETSFATYGQENVLVITRSNKRANLYNQQVRNRLLWFEDELSVGDYLMVVKNNYHWLKADNNASFIANGDIAQVKRIRSYEEEYDLRFANVTIQLVDYGIELEAKLILDTLSSETPALPPQKAEEFFEAMKLAYADEPSRKKLYEKIKEDDHYNALQVKFAYAVTCHKSQGGQWPVVFVDQGYLGEDAIDVEYYRWLYTAVTRASKQVYLVNFTPNFLPEEKH